MKELQIYIPTLELGIVDIMKVICSTSDFFLNTELLTNDELGMSFVDLAPFHIPVLRQDFRFESQIKSGLVELMKEYSLTITTKRIFFTGRERGDDISLHTLRFIKKLGINLVLIESEELQKDLVSLREISSSTYKLLYSNK